MAYLLKMILYALIIFYVIRFFRKAFASLFGTTEEQPNPSRNASRRPEGEVTIEKDRYKGGRIPKDEGEYVDFEEVD